MMRSVSGGRCLGEYREKKFDKTFDRKPNALCHVLDIFGGRFSLPLASHLAALGRSGLIEKRNSHRSKNVPFILA